MSDSKRTPSEKADFKRELTEVIPHLRAFARGLCGRPDMADDLVQEAMMKAWAAQERFEPGTSMRAWTFVILRNAYLTDMRRNRFRGEYDENVAERILTAPADQEEPLHLSDMHRALLTLPPER
ncbi:MAG: sigma factor, partial [Allopontixanthobacter sediminis]